MAQWQVRAEGKGAWLLSTQATHPLTHTHPSSYRVWLCQFTAALAQGTVSQVPSGPGSQEWTLTSPTLWSYCLPHFIQMLFLGLCTLTQWLW